jgi:kynurenine formamidase
LYGRARVVDLRWKDKHTPLQITDLENDRIVANEILILFVGYTPPQDDDWPTYSSLSVQAAQWLAAKKIRALATDMPSIGSFSRYAELMEKGRPPEEVWAERLAFMQVGIPVIEGLTNLGHLLGRKNIVFVGFPLAIADNAGAPMRAAALIF